MDTTRGRIMPYGAPRIPGIFVFDSERLYLASRVLEDPDQEAGCGRQYLARLTGLNGQRLGSSREHQ